MRGVRIVVTRAAHQAEELAAPLRELGAEVLLVPMIGIAPPLDETPLRNAAANNASYDWIVFTSVNAVSAFSRALGGRKLVSNIAAIGPATRDAAERQGFLVSITPQQYIAESLAAALGTEQLAGKKILLPGAAVTRDVVPRRLRELGAHVTVVEAYRNVLPAEATAQAAAIFRDPLPDWLTFASSSAAENTARIVPAHTLGRIRIASIGPATTRTVEELGFRAAVEADPHTIPGLVQAIALASNTM